MKKELNVTEKETETAVLIGVINKQQNEALSFEYLNELAFLAETYGVITKKTFTQKLEKADKATFIGKGKVDFGVKGFIQKSNWNFSPSKSGYGKIIIELCLFQDGSIKSVKHVLGGTMTDKYFIDLAIKAVKENTYKSTGSSASETCGKVTFNIKAQ